MTDPANPKSSNTPPAIETKDDDIATRKPQESRGRQLDNAKLQAIIAVTEVAQSVLPKNAADRITQVASTEIGRTMGNLPGMGGFISESEDRGPLVDAGTGKGLGSSSIVDIEVPKGIPGGPSGRNRG